jgi:hypothetical protein
MSGNPQSSSSGGGANSKQVLTPQQLAIMQGMAGNAPVKAAMAAQPGQAGLLGQSGGGQGVAAMGGNPAAMGGGAMSTPGAGAPQGNAQPAAGGINPQILLQLKQQYPQLFGGSQ